MGSMLEAATTLRGGGDQPKIRVPDRWQQGRGAFGGIALGALARALDESEARDGRSLRAFTADLCRPVMPGEADLEVEVLRRGKHLSNVEARLRQSGDVVARASGALSTPRPVDVPPRQPTPPTPPDWRSLPIVPIEGPLAPVFAQHFEYRLIGPMPLSGGTEAVVEGWIRERTAPSRYDVPLLIAMIDAWWPALFSAITKPMHVATTTFTAEILAEPSSLSPEEPLLHRARVAAVHEGFVVEFRELWAHGRLLVANQQTIVLL